MSEQLHQQLSDAGWHAYRAGLYRQGADFYRKAVAVAEGIPDVRRAVSSMFWLATCLDHAGNLDAALPILLRAANPAAIEADPADVFNAFTRAIDISLRTKSATLTSKLIDEGWQLLTRLGKEHWGHKLWHL